MRIYIYICIYVEDIMGIMIGLYVTIYICVYIYTLYTHYMYIYMCIYIYMSASYSKGNEVRHPTWPP